MREGLKVVSCLEQSFGLDVSDGLVCMWLAKGWCCSQVLLIVLVDDVEKLMLRVVVLECVDRLYCQGCWGPLLVDAEYSFITYLCGTLC